MTIFLERFTRLPGVLMSFLGSVDNFALDHSPERTKALKISTRLYDKTQGQKYAQLLKHFPVGTLVKKWP